MEPRRLGIRYTPPLLTVEFACSKKLYLHEIPMDKYIEKYKDTEIIAKQVQEEHAIYLDDVSISQLTKIIEKLIPKGKPAIHLPSADYNNVSDRQLRLVKDKMDVIFTANVLKPGDSGYIYDKQVEYHPTETSEWDE